jgi:hypothetical protein
MVKGHIFIQHPQSSQGICWICSLTKQEHPYVVEHKDLRVASTRIRKKSKVGRTKASRVGRL